MRPWAIDGKEEDYKYFTKMLKTERSDAFRQEIQRLSKLDEITTKIYGHLCI